MITLGFSLAGLAVSLAVLAPNLALVWAPPRDWSAIRVTVPLPVSALERVGQIGCLVLPAISGTHGHVDPWLVLLVLLVAIYHGLWVRYLLTGRRTAQLYAPLGPVPVPMAVVPVLAFLVAAIWLTTWPLAVAGALLAVGHLTTAARTAHALARER